MSTQTVRRSSTTTGWHVLGVGAMGSLWASCMHRSGKAVRLIPSPRARKALAGDTLLTLSYERLASQWQSTLPVADKNEAIHNLVLATKANDALTALRGVQHQLQENSRILVLCNGMGFHEAIAKQNAQCRVFAVVSTDGAWLKDKYHIVHAGKGLSKLGAVSGNNRPTTAELRRLKKDLACRGLSFATRVNTEAMLLAKLSINAAINGLTAIHRCQNGGLLERTQARVELDRLIREISEVLLAAGHKRIAGRLAAQVNQVLLDTASNYSSTYNDVVNGRRSELKWINGYLVQRATELGVATPENKRILAAVPH